MKRLAVVGVVVLMVANLAALVFVGWNLYSLRQTHASVAPNEMYGRGMMNQYAPREPGAMMGRGMMRGMMGSNTSSAPSTNAPNAGASSSATPSVLSKSGDSYTGKAGNLNVAVTMNPAPAAFSTTNFNITITDEKGAAVSDAKVSLDLTMPSMWMPANKPQAQLLGDGKYQAVGRFTMRGGWRIDVIIERGGVKQNAYFDIGL